MKKVLPLKLTFSKNIASKLDLAGLAVRVPKTKNNKRINFSLKIKKYYTVYNK